MEKGIMDNFLDGLDANGFNPEFKAESNLNGVFECEIYSDGTDIVIIIGENVFSNSEALNPKMAYKIYSCRIGDDEYLRAFLGAELLSRNSSVLAGEYSGMFTGLINKVLGYGTKNSDSICFDDAYSQFHMDEKISLLFANEKQNQFRPVMAVVH